MTIGITRDSRFIGLIPRENLIGRAEIVVVSFDTDIGSLFKFWTWFSALRKDRLFVSLFAKSNRMKRYSKLLNDIGYKFKNFEFLNIALTHSSFNSSEINYEKFEFLGDRVLG